MQYWSHEQIALSIHTHGVAQKPPNAVDISPLIPTAEKGGHQAGIVLAQDTRYLILRTMDSPDNLTFEQASKWAWGEVLHHNSELDRLAHIVADLGKLDTEIQLKNLFRYSDRYKFVIYT